MPRKPGLVLVSGPPASGKSTLARRIAGSFALPLLSRDEIKNHILGGEPAVNDDTSDRVARLAFDFFYARMQHLLERRENVVAEVCFHRGVAESQLAPILLRCHAMLIHLHVPPSVVIDRFAKRAAVETREWARQDDKVMLEQLRAGTLDWSVYAPLALDIPQIHVHHGAAEPTVVEILLRVAGMLRIPMSTPTESWPLPSQIDRLR